MIYALGRDAIKRIIRQKHVLAYKAKLCIIRFLKVYNFIPYRNFRITHFLEGVCDFENDQ